MRYFRLLLILGLIAGCATSAHQAGNVVFRTAGFSPEVLRAGGLVVLPVATESGVEIFRMPFEGSIDDAVRTECEGTDSLFPKETRLVLEDRGLQQQYDPGVFSVATRVEARVFDAATGDLVWQGTGASQVDERKSWFFALSGLDERKSVDVRRSSSVFDAASGVADELARLLCEAG